MGYLLTLLTTYLIFALIGIFIGRLILTYERLTFLLKSKCFCKSFKIRAFVKIFFLCSNKCLSCYWFKVHLKEFCGFNTGTKCKGYVKDDNGTTDNERE